MKSTLNYRYEIHSEQTSTTVQPQVSEVIL